MRSFVAIDLPPLVRKAAGELQAGLKAAGADVKWVKPASMHLTLKFLGEVDKGLKPRLARALEEACQGQKPLRLGLKGVGSFPARGKPRVVWLGLSGQAEGLAGLAARLDQILAGLGFEPEERAFKPHLTLGRVRRPGRGAKGRSTAGLTREIAGLAGYTGPEFTADCVRLMKSELKPTGAEYEPLYTVTLS